MPENVHVIGHPLVQHKLTLLRDKNTPSHEFRRLVKELSMLMAYEVTRDVPTVNVEIETPLEKMKSPSVNSKKLIIVSILRAGNGILDGMLELIPSARVGHIGIYREPKTLVAIEYYFKLPEDTEGCDLIVVDPMLATGHSASAAISRLKSANPRSIKLVTLLCAPEGIEELHGDHPEVPIYTAAVDRCLSDHAYILPGLGDAGDRLYGTR